jgi:hypothetical protein
MTKNQRIKFFGASDPDKKKKDQPRRVNEFLSTRFNQGIRGCNVL